MTAHRSFAGKLVVAPAAMTDPNFADAVTLVLTHNPQGAFGLVLDRRLAHVEVHLPGDWAGRATEVWGGGPCETERLVVLGRPLPNRMPSHYQELCPMLGGLGVIDPTLADIDEFERVRCFAGYAGWGPLQLDRELSLDAWVVADAAESDPFDRDGAGLRGRVLDRLLRSRGRTVPFPDDPSSN